MKCRQAKNLLSPYLDGELDARGEAALAKHLAACAACRQELEVLRAISENLAEVFRRVEPPADLLQKVMARVRELEAAGRIRRAGAGVRRGPAWRKLAVGVGLAAGIGLAALQIGRAGVGPAGLPGAPQAPSGAVATRHAEGPAPQEEPRLAAKPSEEVGSQAGGGKLAAPEAKAGKPRAAQVEVRVGGLPKAAAKGGGAATAAQKPAGTAGAAQLASAAGGSGAELKAFLACTRHVRTTMVKLAVADLEAARAAVASAAIEARALEVREAWSYQDEQVILRVVLPTAGAERFMDEVSGLGAVTGRRTETADVTNEFNRRLAEYRELAAKSDPQSRALAEAAEKILEALDAESLEAGREVVNVWLALRQS